MNNIRKISVSDIGLSKRDTPRQTKDVYPQNVFRGHTILNQRIVKRYRTHPQYSIGGGKQGSVQSIIFTDICWCWKATGSLSGEYWTPEKKKLYKKYIINVNRAQNPYDSPVFSVFNGENIEHFREIFGTGKNASLNVLSAIIPVGMHMKPDDSVLYTDAFFDRNISSEYCINRVLLCEKGEFHFKNEHPTQTLYKGDLIEVYLPEIDIPVEAFGSTRWMEEYKPHVYKKYQNENRLKLLYRKHEPKKMFEDLHSPIRNEEMVNTLTDYLKRITRDDDTPIRHDTLLSECKDSISKLFMEIINSSFNYLTDLFEQYANKKRYVFGVMTETARKNGGTGKMIFNFHNLGLL